MVGKETPCVTVPFFWTGQYGKSLRYAGRNQVYRTQVVFCSRRFFKRSIDAKTSKACLLNV